MFKRELRNTNLQRQKELSVIDRNRKSKQITDKFFQNFDFTEISLIHCFVAIEKFNEIDTSGIFEQLWLKFPKIQTTIPRVDFQTGEIENRKFTAKTRLKENIWQIKEPDSSELVDIEKNDLILVPLVGFDENGFRAGYGKGLYDRFLARCRDDCVKIGLSYFAPVKKIFDVRNFDVKLDFCITPDKIWQF